MERQHVTLSEKKVPVVTEVDVCVVGGGPAGVGAAIRSARNGANTVVIERFGSLGGVITNGFMFVSGKFGSVATEIMDRLKPTGSVADIGELCPAAYESRLTHYGVRPSGAKGTREPMPKLVFDPHMTSCVMNDLMEEHKVKLMFRSLFVDTIVEGGTIKAVVVENASGKQAIASKVFIDATGCGDVVARAGCPFKSPGDEKGLFSMPPGLMWTMGGVNVARIFEYEAKEDPGLEKITAQARERGELPYYSRKRTPDEMHAGSGTSYSGWHTGHPRLEFMPGVHPGTILLWAPAPYDWKPDLNIAESAEDLSYCEAQIRKAIVSELAFLKKHVPGFEKAHLAGVAPMMGKREGRHPIGEYVLTFEDLESGRKFEDAAYRQRGTPPMSAEEKVNESAVEIEVPYRCFLAQKVDNLLLSGDNLSMTFSAAPHIKGFGIAMNVGEVAGTAAALSVKQGIKPKALKMKPLEVDIRYHYAK